MESLLSGAMVVAIDSLKSRRRRHHAAAVVVPLDVSLPPPACVRNALSLRPRQVFLGNLPPKTSARGSQDRCLVPVTDQH